MLSKSLTTCEEKMRALYSKQLLFIIFGLQLVACSSAVRYSNAKTPPANSEANPEYYSEVGYASFYADSFVGKTTASGEIYDSNELTAAHRSLPFGTKLKVTNLDNQLTIIVRVNDRGPFVPSRIVDLSTRAAKELDMLQKGIARVKIEVVK